MLALIRQNQRAAKALQAVVDAVKADPGTAVGVATLFSFVGMLWDEGLMLKLFRYALSQTGWRAAAWAAAELLKWAILPEAEAAELVVSFAIWAYTVTTDALAYVNSSPGQTALA